MSKKRQSSVSGCHDNKNRDEKHAWISKLLSFKSTQRQNPGVSQSYLNRMEEDLTSRLILIPEADIAVHPGIVREHY